MIGLLDPVVGMVGMGQAASGEPAPRRKVLRRSQVSCGQLEHVSGLEIAHPRSEQNEYLTAAHITRVPLVDNVEVIYGTRDRGDAVSGMR